jgi:hypothetical protein
MKRRRSYRFAPLSIEVEKLHAFPEVKAEDDARLAAGYARKKAVPAYPRQDGTVSFTIVWKKQTKGEARISIRIKWRVGLGAFRNAVQAHA